MSERAGEVEEALRRALIRLRAGKRAAALASLIDAWRVSPDGGLTRAILVVAARVEDGQALIDTRRQWLHVERSRRVADIARLAATVERTRGWGNLHLEDALDRLAAPLPVEHLTLHRNRGEGHDLVADTEIFPRLRQLTVEGSVASFAEWLPRSRLASGLQRLRQLPLHQVGELLALARALPPSLAELVLGENSLVFRRDESGRFARLHARRASWLRRLLEVFADDLHELTSIELDDEDALPDDSAAIDRIAAAQSRWRLTLAAAPIAR